MKLTINQEKFEKHLNNINKALENNPHLMILKGLVIIANESNIELIGSNGNLSIKEIINVNNDFDVQIPGKILIPGKLFIQLIKKQGKIISLFVDDNSLKIQSEGFETSINLLNIEEYPRIDFDLVSKEKEFIIDSNIIKNIIRDVAFAADERNDNVILSGVNFKTKEQTLIITATNKFRLARETIGINQKINFDFTILARNLKDFLPIEAKGEIAINLSDTKILTSYKNTFVLVKLIDGIFPNVEKIIPDHFESSLTINVNHLLVLIDKASTINNEYQNTLTFKIVPNELTIESNKNEIGNIIVKTNQMVWTGSEFQITFNANFLKDAITKFEQDITINFSGQQKLFIIKGASNKNLLQLILPHRNY